MDKEKLNAVYKEKKYIKNKYKKLLKNAKTQEEKRNIQNAEINEYNEKIYQVYGKDIFLKIVPRNIRKKDRRKLQAEGRFIEIENKYLTDSELKEKYNTKLINLHAEAMKKEGASALSVALYKFKNYMKYKILPVGLSTAALLYSGGNVLFISTHESEVKNNAQKYEEEIQEYNKNIENYAQEIQNLKLTELETIMLVMDDMWNSIKGYKNPEKDILGYLALDLATEEGYGVCRNMADDVAKKLNAINPNYEAIVMAVSAKTDGNVEFADIPIKLLEGDQTIESAPENSVLDNVIGKIFGNHAVVLLKSQQYDINLIIDPTNPSVGICYNGKIIMFNSTSKDGYDLEYNLPSDKFLNGIQAYENFSDVEKIVFGLDKEKLEKIKEEYSIENQNKALSYVRNLRKLPDFDKKLVIAAHQKDDNIKNVNYLSNENTREFEEETR